MPSSLLESTSISLFFKFSILTRLTFLLCRYIFFPAKKEESTNLSGSERTMRFSGAVTCQSISNSTLSLIVSFTKFIKLILVNETRKVFHQQQARFDFRERKMWEKSFIIRNLNEKFREFSVLIQFESFWGNEECWNH